MRCRLGVIRVRIADMVNKPERATRFQRIEYRREKFCGSFFALAVVDVVKVECREMRSRRWPALAAASETAALMRSTFGSRLPSRPGGQRLVVVTITKRQHGRRVLAQHLALRTPPLWRGPRCTSHLMTRYRARYRLSANQETSAPGPACAEHRAPCLRHCALAHL